MRFQLPKSSRSHADDPRLVPSERFTHQLHGDPFLDWVIILCVSLLVAAALVAADVSVYLDTGARLKAPVSASSGASAQAIDTTVLQRTIDAFDSRAAEHSALVKGYSAPRDPSLP